MKTSYPKKLILGILFSVIIAGGVFVFAQNAQAQIGAPIQGPAMQGQFNAVKEQAKDTGKSDTEAAADAANSVTNLPSLTDLLTYPVMKIVNSLLFLVVRGLSWIIQLGGSLVDWALSIGSFTEASFVRIGWSITRDLCNMAFAIILLFMAFGTVLQVGSVNHKLLPKLIIVALLINFSLVFAGIVIDFAQILTFYFVDAVKGDSGLSAQIMNAFGIAKAYDIDDIGTKVAIKGVYGSETKIFLNLITVVVLFSITAFMFLLFALLLVGRIIIIWIHLAFLPLALVSWLVKIPGGGDLLSWSKWKDEFLKWVFFAPAYMFFIYLALRMAQESTFEHLLGENELFKANTQGELSNGFFKEPWVVFQYIAMVMIMLMGLDQAKKVGPHAGKLTGKMTGWAKSKTVDKVTKKATDWPKRPGQFVYDKFAPNLAKWTATGAGLIGLEKFSKRFGTKPQDIQDKAMERPQHKAYRGSVKRMPPDALAYEVKHADGIRKLIAAEEQKARGMKKLSVEDAREVMKTFKQFNRKKDLDEAEELRPEAVGDAEKQKQAIFRAIENGKISQWNLSTFAQLNPTNRNLVNLDANGNPIVNQVPANADPPFSLGANVLKNMMQGLTDMDFSEAFKGLPRQMKLAWEAAMSELVRNPNNVIPGPELEKIRRNFANNIGKIEKAFTDTAGNFDANAAKNHIESMNPENIANVKGFTDLDFIGQNISLRQLLSIKNELNGSQKETIMEGIRHGGNQENIDFINNDQFWAGSRRRGRRGGQGGQGGQQGQQQGTIINPATMRPFNP